MFHYKKAKLRLFIVMLMVFVIGCEAKSIDKAADDLEEATNVEVVEVALKQTEKSSAQVLSELANQQFSINNDEISDDDYETIVAFGEAFVNLYTGAVPEQTTVTFDNYISNVNLHKFTSIMLGLEQRRELKGGIGVNFSLDNEFQEAELTKLDENLYYLSLPFSNQGSGMNCKLLVQSENKLLKIVDLYFGNKDGVDTFATGHPAVRKLDNPKLWDDQTWVDGVFEKLKEYE